MRLMILGREKYIQQRHYCLIQVPLIFKLLLKSWKVTNHQVLIESQQKRLNQGGWTIRCEVHKLINFLWNKKDLPEEWKESNIVPICKKRDKTDCSNYRGISLCQLHTRFIQYLAVKANSICYGNYLGSSMWIPTQQFNYWSHKLLSSNTWEKWENSEVKHQLFIDFKKAYDSVRGEVLYNILVEFGISMELERLIKMCLN
jgi:hypothetical protein